MTTIIQNKNKNTMNNKNAMEEYLTIIELKCQNNMPFIKKIQKIIGDNIPIPTVKTYNQLIYNNYNISQLKSFAKNYKLKINGNKQQLVSRIYCYLYLSFYSIKIQKIFRSKLVQKYKQLHGPAAFNRKLCTNTDDFISMELVEDINFHQFISYKDKDEFIYGFDINSLHNLIIKSTDTVTNPYNRISLPTFLIKNIKSIIRISKILDININLIFDDDTKNVTNEKAIELRALNLFQLIDSLGNYSNADWFLSLNRNRLLKFIRELMDIWNYRAQISIQTKVSICPPIGNPFINISIQYLYTEENIWNIKKILIETMEKLIYNGVDKDSKSLGAYYILGALTLVNQEAANSLSWLFQSFNYVNDFE